MTPAREAPQITKIWHPTLERQPGWLRGAWKSRIYSRTWARVRTKNPKPDSRTPARVAPWAPKAKPSVRLFPSEATWQFSNYHAWPWLRVRMSVTSILEDTFCLSFSANHYICENQCSKMWKNEKLNLKESIFTTLWAIFRLPGATLTRGENRYYKHIRTHI